MRTMPGLPRCLLPGSTPHSGRRPHWAQGMASRPPLPLVEPTGTSEAHFPKDRTGSAWALHKPHVRGSFGLIQTYERKPSPAPYSCGASVLSCLTCKMRAIILTSQDCGEESRQ